MRILVRLLGLILAILAALFAIYMTTLAAWGANSDILDYLLVGGTMIGVYGPIFILGIHCLIFRWRISAEYDRYLIIIIGICAAISVVLFVTDLGVAPTDFRGAVLFLGSCLVSSVVCTIGVKLWR